MSLASGHIEGERLADADKNDEFFKHCQVYQVPRSRAKLRPDLSSLTRFRARSFIDMQNMELNLLPI